MDCPTIPGSGSHIEKAQHLVEVVGKVMDGVVAAILVKPGEIVAPGQMLVEIQSVEDANEHASGSAASS